MVNVNKKHRPHYDLWAEVGLNLEMKILLHFHLSISYMRYAAFGNLYLFINVFIETAIPVGYF